MKKKRIMGIVSVIVGAIVVIFAVYVYQNQDYNFNYDPLTFEYGEYEEITLEDIVTDEKILKTAELELKDNSEEVGTYEGSITYTYRMKSRNFIFTYSIVDTAAPEFVDFKEKLTVEQNAKDVTVLDYFEAKDLSEDVTLSIDQEKFDFSETGEFKLKISASDKYNNKNEKDITIIVVDLETARKDGVSETIDGKKPQSQQLIDLIKEEAEIKQSESENSDYSAVVYKDTSSKNNESNNYQGSGGNSSSSGYDMSNPIVAKAIAMVGTVNEGGFGVAGIGGSFVCDDLVAVALEAGGLGAYAYNYPSDFGSYVSYSQAAPGDVLRYVSSDGSNWGGHVAIYIGNGMAVHGNFGRVTTIFSATGLDNMKVEPLVWKVQ